MPIEKPEPAEGVEVDVPDEIFSQLEAVRQTGAVNMLNVHGVQDVAEQCGFEELEEWLADRYNRREKYSDVLTGSMECYIELDSGGRVEFGLRGGRVEFGLRGEESSSGEFRKSERGQ